MIKRPRIMGVLNATHDSFFAPSRALESPDGESLDTRVERMIAEGADYLDVGGESSRPGSEYVSLELELARTIPVIRTIRRISPTIPISIDTRKAAVARAAIEAGAGLINDISGLRDDPEMVKLAVETGVELCIMHMRGTPATMQQNPQYEDTVTEVIEELGTMLLPVLEAGVARDRIILDPGIGFGKRFSDNWMILRHLERFQAMGFPLLMGLSRKSFLGALPRRTSGVADESLKPPEERLYATLAAELWCTMHGVSIIRVHDVRPLAEMLDVMEKIATAV